MGLFHAVVWKRKKPHPKTCLFLIPLPMCWAKIVILVIHPHHSICMLVSLTSLLSFRCKCRHADKLCLFPTFTLFI